MSILYIFLLLLVGFMFGLKLFNVAINQKYVDLVLLGALLVDLLLHSGLITGFNY